MKSKTTAQTSDGSTCPECHELHDTSHPLEGLRHGAWPPGGTDACLIKPSAFHGSSALFTQLANTYSINPHWNFMP